MPRTRIHRVVTHRLRATLLISALTLIVAAVLPAHSHAETPADLAGSAGVNPAPPLTSSAVTVTGRGSYSSLAVTVNQTEDLTNQTISVTWKGGQPTTSPPTSGTTPEPFDGVFYANFLSIFQCWGDPQPSDPLTAVNPGPQPTQCEQGGAAVNATRAYPTGSNLVGATKSATRILDYPGDANFKADEATGGYVSQPKDGASGVLFEPFTAVDGTTVGASENINGISDPNQSFWLNPYFSYNDTNEVPYGRTYPDGTGAQLIVTDTGLEAPGLGCGQTVQPLADGTKKIPQCWLVVVPETSVTLSPVSPEEWANRIAIPLGFRTVDSPCNFGSDERRLDGSELAAGAISSWQPTLCSQSGLIPYSYTALGDDQARAGLPGAAPGGAQMAVVTDPLDPTTLPSTAVYAPLTLSALTIGFNIERVPTLDPKTGQYNADEAPLATTRVATVKLTPRLVAKLLTESYQDEFLGRVAGSKDGRAWLAHNAGDLFSDPDFQQFNPEFKELSAAFPVNASQLEVEFATSDATAALWQWISGDKEAAAWLAGTPDEWGMTVNPVYSTSPGLNPAGIGFSTTGLNTFPDSDPYCEPTKAIVVGNAQVPSPCILNWDPYALTMQDAAARTQSTNTGSNTTPNANAPNADAYYAADGAQTTGYRVVLSVTDSVSAAHYGLQTASLSRDDDDSSTRAFIAADTDGILAGEASMKPSPTVPGVLLPDPATTAPGAYPLSLLTYAVTVPATLDSAAAKDYAHLVDYGAGAGQTPGTAFGQLPPGYVPLPAALTAEDASAVKAILSEPTSEAPTTAPPPPAPAAAPVASSSGSAPVATDGSSGGGPVPSTAGVTSTPSIVATLGSEAGASATPQPVSSAAPIQGPGTGALSPKSRLAVARTPKSTVGGSRYLPLVGLIVAAVAALSVLVRRPRSAPRRPR